MVYSFSKGGSGHNFKKTGASRVAAKILSKTIAGGIKKPTLPAAYLPGANGAKKKASFAMDKMMRYPSKKLISENNALNYNGVASMKTRK